MIYNGVFRCHGNIGYVTFTDACFCNVHSIGPINVCANFEINRYTIDEFRKHATIVCFIWCQLTQKRYVVRHSSRYIFRLGTFWNQQGVSMTSASKVMAQSVCFYVFGDLYSTCYHTQYAWSTGVFFRDFIRIRRVLMGDMAADTPTNTETHTPNVKTIAPQIPSGSTNYVVIGAITLML